MALITTIDQIKQYLAVNVSSKFDSLLPYIERAELKYIKPTLGADQYNALVSWVDQSGSGSASASVSDEDYEALLVKVRRALANLAYYLYIPIGQVQISDSGIRIASTENLKTAFQWQVDKIEQSFLDAGYESLEDMLEFLEENKDTYTTWAESDAYTEFKELFISTARVFNQYFNISASRRTFVALQATMRKVEDFYIKATLGNTLFAEIKTQILSGEIDDDNESYLEKIRPAVANLTISRAIADLSVKITDQGAVVINLVGDTSRQKTTAPDNQLSMMARQAEADGEAYLNMLQRELDASESSESGSASAGGIDNSQDRGFYVV